MSDSHGSATDTTFKWLGIVLTVALAIYALLYLTGILDSLRGSPYSAGWLNPDPVVDNSHRVPRDWQVR